MSAAEKIVHLPGTALTPKVVLHRSLDKVDRIKSVAVVIQWDDGTFDVDWSRQKVAHMLYGATIYRMTAEQQVLVDVKE